MQRPSTSLQPGQAGGSAVDHDWADSFPQLHAHLADTTWDDGSERSVSTLLIFSEDGVWKACLHDREAGATLWATGDSINGVIGAVEGLLGAGHQVWRKDKTWTRGKGRK